MKEELKKKMIGVIGTHSNALIESIAEKCAQVAIDHYKERESALNMSGVKHRFSIQPLDIEKVMKEKFKQRVINDDLGWTGEWRMSAKDVLDVFFYIQDGA